MTEQPAAPSAPRMVAVADGVHAYIQPDGGWYLNNAVLIDGPDAAISIDSAATEARTAAYQDEIARVTDRPVRTVVATHHHGDHTHGNHLFSGATIVSHPYCRDRVLREDYHAVLPMFAGPEWGDIRAAGPAVTFAERLELWSGERRVELRHPGRAAHTHGDVYAWLPDDRLLISGDLIFNGGTPMLAEGSPTGLLRTLEEIGELAPRLIVPGHGEPCGLEAVEATTDYLRWILGVARDAHAEGLSPLDAARSIDAGRFSGLREPERLVMNLHSCYAEFEGTAVDMGQLAADTFAIVGGPIPSCA
ncbi:MBL fold metallo-hydrolase [Streptomyces sp. PTM05]|uniref:MBL fold metallo-hydrolase n=1 Tax=Streptantibioticus parmotrematis TaxID=2873249 RepID=A0ABS7QUU9_9ACTN|nr:MBL fold metallo-hydrolase [Streptantibioticus parmotrematis]MBY8885572.1 MBL fold metallo-hydrolase [Streptantibioticus parmotrematis]